VYAIHIVANLKERVGCVRKPWIVVSYGQSLGHSDDLYLSYVTGLNSVRRVDEGNGNEKTLTDSSILPTKKESEKMFANTSQQQ